MKNFQGLHKCATGAVVNTEDFNKSNNLTSYTAVAGTEQEKPKNPWLKQHKKYTRKKNRCGKGFSQQ